MNRQFINPTWHFVSGRFSSWWDYL